MSGEKRADGFWWVRRYGPWTVVQVDLGGGVRWPASEADGPDGSNHVDHMHPDIEWGPYLGRGPRPVEQPDVEKIDTEYTFEPIDERVIIDAQPAGLNSGEVPR